MWHGIYVGYLFAIALHNKWNHMLCRACYKVIIIFAFTFIMPFNKTKSLSFNTCNFMASMLFMCFSTFLFRQKTCGNYWWKRPTLWYVLDICHHETARLLKDWYLSDCAVPLRIFVEFHWGTLWRHRLRNALDTQGRRYTYMSRKYYITSCLQYAKKTQCEHYNYVL